MREFRSRQRSFRCVESAQCDGGCRAAAGRRQYGDGRAVGDRRDADTGQCQPDSIFDPAAEIPLRLIIRFVDTGRLNQRHWSQLAGESFVVAAEEVAKGFLLIVVEKNEQNADQEGNGGDDGQKQDVEFDLKQPTD